MVKGISAKQNRYHAIPLQGITKQQTGHQNNCSEDDEEFLDACSAQLCGAFRVCLMHFHHCTFSMQILQTLGSGPAPVTSRLKQHTPCEHKYLKNSKGNIKYIFQTIKEIN